MHNISILKEKYFIWNNNSATKAQRRDMNFKPLSKRPVCVRTRLGREESIAEKIVDAAYGVHMILIPGLLEKVYEVR